MLCKEPISHVGKCQHLFKHAGMFFVSQGKIPTAVPPADTRQCTAPGRVCATQHCVSVPHSPSLPWWSLQVQEEYMLNTQPLSAAWCSVLVSLLGIDMHIERFQKVREQVEGTGYPYKGGNSKFWALLHFVSVSLLRTQWTCILQVFLFKSLVRATYPAVRLKTIPTNPLWLVIDFSLFFLTWSHVATEWFIILIVKLLFSEKWAYFWQHQGTCWHEAEDCLLIYSR